MAQELISIIIKYLFPSPVKKKKMFHTHEIEGWQPELIYGILRTIDLPVNFSSFLVVTGRMLQSQN